MAHRERAKGRLERRIPGECVRKSSRVVEAIEYRTREVQRFEPRAIYGAALIERSTPTENPAKTITTGPHSPLLIRLVRDPYALETAKMKRVRVRGADERPSRKADPFPRVMTEWDKARFKGFSGNPARSLGIGPEVRPSPTAHQLPEGNIGRWRCR
jgi:hypothetical protein